MAAAPSTTPYSPRPQEVQDCHQFGDQILPHLQAISSISCELCGEPFNQSCHSGCCECHAFFVINVHYGIKCKGAGFGYDADTHRLEAACGVADCSAHAGGCFAPILIFSAQLHASPRMSQCETQVLAVLEILEQGSIITILTLMLLPYYFQRRPCTLCLISYNGFSVLQIYLSGCYKSDQVQAAVHDVFAIFTLGLIRRRWVRASSMWFLRFSGEDISDLSSVIHILDLQLNPLPQRRLPT